MAANPKLLKLTVRNIDFGPIKDGLFMQAQFLGAKKHDMGDNLFFPPRNTSGTQYGYEDAWLNVTVQYKDKSQTVLNYQRPLPTLGNDTLFDVKLDQEFSAIQKVQLVIETNSFTFAMDDMGAGMYHTSTTPLASTELEIEKDGLPTEWMPERDRLMAKISLSPMWDFTESIPRSNVLAHPYKDKLLNLSLEPHFDEAVDKKEQTEHYLGQHWRSELADCYLANGASPDASPSISYIPLALLGAPKGWVQTIRTGASAKQEEHLTTYRQFTQVLKDHLKTAKEAWTLLKNKQENAVQDEQTQTKVTEPEKKLSTEMAQVPTEKKFVGEAKEQADMMTQAKNAAIPTTMEGLSGRIAALQRYFQDLDRGEEDTLKEMLQYCPQLRGNLENTIVEGGKPMGLCLLRDKKYENNADTWAAKLLPENSGNKRSASSKS